MRKLFALLPLLSVLAFSGAQAGDEVVGGENSAYYNVVRTHTVTSAISDWDVSRVCLNTEGAVAAAASTQSAVSAAFNANANFSPLSVFDNLLANYWQDLKNAAYN